MLDKDLVRAVEITINSIVKGRTEITESDIDGYEILHEDWGYIHFEKTEKGYTAEYFDLHGQQLAKYENLPNFQDVAEKFKEVIMKKIFF